MSEQYKIQNPQGLYFVTFTIVKWIDLFTRPSYKIELINNIQFCQKEKGLVVHAWVLMHSHLHAILSTRNSPTKGGLSGIIRDLKKHTSKVFISMILADPEESRKRWLLVNFESAGKELERIKDYKVWQDGSHPEELESNHFIQQKLDYIHYNPVHALLVDEPELYKYSSAIDYAGGKGLIEVELLD